MAVSTGPRAALAAALLAVLAGCGGSGSPPSGSQPSHTPVPSSAPRVGVEQPVSTAEFDALIIVAERVDPSPGDAPYVVDVTVAVTRGSWSFAPTLVRLIWSSGERHGPQANASAPATLVAGQVKTWRLRFDHPAVVGIGHGAKVTVVGPSGQELATWLT